jgi:NAD(P)-dependent dehydrogenase (short-subunit alcohol dehydrogenase family)
MTSNPFDLSGKVAIVTGGNGGIGLGMARGLAEAGAAIAVVGRNEAKSAAAAAELRARGAKAIAVTADVTDQAAVADMVARTLRDLGGIDILVNNAGMFLGKGIEEASLDEWHRLCAINLTGVFLGTKLTLPALRERATNSPHGSAIVNLASVAGLVGSQLDPLYSMTKGGVTLFTKSAALEFARKGYRIRVNSIHPGVIQTDMGEQTFSARARNIGSNDVDDARRMALATHPIGRLGVPNDIAKGIVFLASDDAGFMTGAGLVVDGGLTAQ